MTYVIFLLYPNSKRSQVFSEEASNMLARCNDNQLVRYQRIDSEFIFLYQRWCELLDSRTLDMYQYNILNSFVACKELSDVIEKTMSGLLTSRQNVDDCKEEAFQIIKADEILEKYNRPLKITLIRILSSKIEGKSREESSDNKNGAQYISLNRLKYQLLTPIRQLESSYLSYILDALKESIDSQDNVRIEKCEEYLISQCIFDGWSARGLFQLVDHFSGDKPKEAKWQEFRNRIENHAKKTYEIYYSIKIETQPGLGAGSIREIIRSLGLQTETGSQIIEASGDRPTLCSKVSPTVTYLKMNVEAPDIYAGVLLVINTINGKLSIASFYNILSPWIANSPQIIVYDTESCSAESLKLTDVFKTFDYIDSHNSIFEDTNKIFQEPAKKEIITKIGAAFAYTNLSRSALFQETKYISLWIALESLMRTGQYSDIISHIKLVLPEIMCTRYIYRIVRNFSEDCIRCGITLDTCLGLDLQSPDKKELVRDLITVFRDPTKYAILQHRCNRNSLLLYRCDDLFALLTNTNEIIKRLDHYTQKIRWHIQRLYRIRNEITHSAFKQNKSLIIYIEHLYSYLAQIMGEIVFYIANKNVSSVEEALAVLKENYLTFYEILKGGTISINDVLANGVIELV